MKTTLELPDTIYERATRTAKERHTSLDELLIQGLEKILAEQASLEERRAAALARLRQGFPLGGKPLTRDEANER